MHDQRSSLEGTRLERQSDVVKQWGVVISTVALL
jgi:hypothetical protein